MPLPLFKHKLKSPTFTRRSRQAIIDGGELDWSAINPDIFGSMIQAVVTPEHRGGLGMHYTSVPNIMKVIEPLFLNELYEEYEKARGNTKKVDALLDRIRSIKIFDPACGSGNFLIIAYKELRRLEMHIFRKEGRLAFSGISLSQFYGIEIDDFAHEIAQLSLWLAEHQMNVEFYNEFGRTNPTLPLKQAGRILCGNAAQMNWHKVCSISDDDECMILGNPPYKGARYQSPQQKEDVQLVFSANKEKNSLDYISIWFRKAATFIRGKNVKAALVSTNSLVQGQHVAALWPDIFSLGVEICFAQTAFKWSNSAKKNAGVTVVIVGLANIDAVKEKYIFTDNLVFQAENISPYLSNSRNVFVKKRTKPLSSFPSLVFGNQAIEDGKLMLSKNEFQELKESDGRIENFIRPVVGAEEFLYGKDRYCIWVKDDQYPVARELPELDSRFRQVKQFREQGGQVARSLVDIPYRFRYVHEAKEQMLVIPRTTSESREYLPVGVLSSEFIVTDAVQVIYDPNIFIFSVLSSRIHYIWTKAVAGGLETRIRYSNTLCYNTFPFPAITKRRQDELFRSALGILEARERFSEKTIAELYEPSKMPEQLSLAHAANDLAVDKCYRSQPFSGDTERLEYLFKLYEAMVEDEANEGGLFGAEKKVKRRR